MKLRQRTFGNMLANAILTPISGLIVAAGILLIGLNVRVPILDLPAITWLVGLVPVWLVAVGAKVLDLSAERRDPEGHQDHSHIDRAAKDADDPGA